MYVGNLGPIQHGRKHYNFCIAKIPLTKRQNNNFIISIKNV